MVDWRWASECGRGRVSLQCGAERSLLLPVYQLTFVLTICNLRGLAPGAESVVPTMATNDVQKSISTIDTGPTSGVSLVGRTDDVRRCLRAGRRHTELTLGVDFAKRLAIRD